MRIISSFKDYYDYALAWASVDDSLTYKRETKILYAPPYPFSSLLVENTTFLDYRIAHTILVFFCGKVYVGIAYQHTGEFHLPYRYAYKEQAIAVWEQAQTDRKQERYILYKAFYRRVRARLEELMHLPDDTLLEVYRTHHAPVFALCGDNLTINPCLKEIGFPQVMEGSQALQSIEQFMGGVLGVPENLTLSVSNEDKIIKHGFDTKWSFRKESTGKKS